MYSFGKENICTLLSLVEINVLPENEKCTLPSNFVLRSFGKKCAANVALNVIDKVSQI